MKHAVLTSKCCFKSFCDKCIRDHIIMYGSTCVCGATDVLADGLLPNRTLRDIINQILESGSSSNKAGSTSQPQDMVSGSCLPPSTPSPTMSATSKGEGNPSPLYKETPEVHEIADTIQPATAPQQTEEKTKLGNAPLVEEEMQQVASSKAGKKKKKKRVHAPASGNCDMLWKTPQQPAFDTYTVPMEPSSYNPCWSGFQPGMDFTTSYAADIMPYMGYGQYTLGMPFGGFGPQVPFALQGCMLHGVPLQRDAADFSMGMDLASSIMISMEETGAQNNDFRKRENEKRAKRKFSKDGDFGREMRSNGDFPSMKPKSVSIFYHLNFFPLIVVLHWPVALEVSCKNFARHLLINL